MEQLYEAAAAAGILVMEADLPRGEEGRYYESHQCIVLNAGMSTSKMISAFAHELGHATLRHGQTLDARVHQRQERQADEYAARLLIDSAEFEETERLYSSDTDTLAYHLGVTPKLIRVWRELALRGHERIN
jgi:Zn-dependent peptidase ImmA (M78 family)